jgi:hypothetical protein
MFINRINLMIITIIINPSQSLLDISLCCWNTLNTLKVLYCQQHITINLQFNIGANALEIRAVQSANYIVWYAVEYTCIFVVYICMYVTCIGVQNIIYDNEIGNETWIYCYNPEKTGGLNESICATTEWYHTNRKGWTEIYSVFLSQSV